MTYKELLKEGENALLSKEIPDYKYDAGRLLEEAFGIDRNFYYLYMENEAPTQGTDIFKKYIDMRKNHIPLQHILGKTEFCGLEFVVNEDVLIPRFDTEILVDKVLGYIKDGDRILDMCTGSGCIILSLEKLSKNNICGVGVDVSKKALALALENKKIHESKVEFVLSNLFENITEKYDIIVSNPPYIRTKDIEELSAEVKEHEPRLALDGMEDGLYFYEKITASAVKHLNTGGHLFYEIGYDQGKDVSDIMEKQGFSDIGIVKDLAGLDRVVYGKI